MPGYASGIRNNAQRKVYYFLFVIGMVAGFVFVTVELQYYDDSLYEKPAINMRRYTGRSTPPVYTAPAQDEVSQLLSKKIRILCWIMTCPAKLNKAAVHVRNTWGKRCTKILYMSSENTTFPTIAVTDHVEGYVYLWHKSRGAHQYVYDHYVDDFDWFLKADDDTYVVMENLRMLAAQYDPNEPFHLGRRLKYQETNRSFMSGGAGYVLSRGALKILVEKAFHVPDKCPPANDTTGEEDVKLTRCLWAFGVQPIDALIDGRESFHCFAPPIVLQPDSFPDKHWYARHSYHPIKRGPECCSDYSISFHYVEGDWMYMLEYMIYQMRPFGVGYHGCPDNITSIFSTVTPLT